MPGASLAILDRGETTALATGVTNCETQIRTTQDTVFQIGSITKVWTTTLIMQLVERNQLSLDAPLARAVPELTLATPGATEQVTVRNLLSHSSGIDGDLIDDTGRGDDCLARYVATCGRLPLLHPVGVTMSYCNPGFVIAGRVVELNTRQTWDAALANYLIRPLGLKRTITLPEEAVRYRVAHGHIWDHGKQILAHTWAPPRSVGPAGLIIATASDVLGFCRLHLNHGRTADGTKIISPNSVDAMQHAEVEIPGGHLSGASHVGLGWFLFDWDGHRVFGHDGDTIGQYAFLRVLPERSAAVCLLTNGGQARALYQDLFAEIFARLWEVNMPEAIHPPEALRSFDPESYVGHYERECVMIDVESAGTGLFMSVTNTGPFAEESQGQVDHLSLTYVAGDKFVGKSKDSEFWMPVVFYRAPGEGAYVHLNGRAVPRRV